MSFQPRCVQQKTSSKCRPRVRTTKNFVKMSPGGAYNKKTWPGQAKRSATLKILRPKHGQAKPNECPFFWAHQRKISALIGSQPEENQRIDLNQPSGWRWAVSNVFFVKRTYFSLCVTSSGDQKTDFWLGLVSTNV